MPVVLLESFAPRVTPGCTRLILGSMPGQRSLNDGHYYAHPQNAFWKILGETLGFSSSAPWHEKYEALALHGIALWDVVHRCERPGSLDQAIVPDSIEPNAIGALVLQYPGILRVGFNGATAERLFRRYVAPTLVEGQLPTRVLLPSTSPAHASVPYAAKRAAWQAFLRD
jgi:TDG/mug DNA glycosylase family protein